MLKRELSGKNARRNRAIRRTKRFVDNLEVGAEFIVSDIVIDMENMSAVIGRYLKTLDNLEEISTGPRKYRKKW